MGTEPQRTNDRYDKTSPWPIVVVLGLVLSELGILFNVYAASIVGLVLFVASVSGIVNEAGYVVSPWRLLVSLGAALVVLGLLVVSLRVDGGFSASVGAAAAADSVLQRGLTIAAAGGIVSVSGIVVPRVVTR
ncbi:cox cluster protein [Natronomonas sp. LN261]|jgi:hypothetical protein|uniref:DUF7541 family protein n=1 Tax=Natronomonas sp. LN261 TaxID=2750669 RepID=UPI0015EF5D95|nr:cox cluster protein [Natronomonas sp. LN261]